MSARRRPLFVTLAVITAVIYNLWPLGFILNPNTARYGLVSDLGADGQPYHWLFIGGDLVCGMLCLIIVWLCLAQYGNFNRYANIAYTGLGMFGTLTAVSAALPLNCSAGLKTCGYNPGQSLGAHDITGAFAALGIFIGLCAMWRAVSQTKKLFTLNSWMLGIWSAWGIIFALTPLRIVQQLSNFQTLAIIWQQLFLILSGLAIICIVLSLDWVLRQEGLPA